MQRRSFIKTSAAGLVAPTALIRYNKKPIKNRMGKPMIKLNNKIISFLKKKYKIKKFEVFLSLADEKKYSIAYVIINKIKS